MSQLKAIAATAGVTTADVVRVARQGGTAAADWDIAAAIEAAGGRPAAETMWSGHTRRPAPQAPAPTNPAAEHDPEVTVYGENTSPEDANRIAPHHPGGDIPADDEVDEHTQVEELAAEVFSDLADLIGLVRALRVTASWTRPAAARTELHRLLADHPSTRDRVRTEGFEVALAA